MATHSSILAWRVPRTEEPGGLQSMGPQRVRQDWVHTRVIWGTHTLPIKAEGVRTAVKGNQAPLRVSNLGLLYQLGILSGRICHTLQARQGQAVFRQIGK